jgi:hypothetical protein
MMQKLSGKQIKKQKPEYNKDTSRPQKLHDIPKDNTNVWASTW